MDTTIKITSLHLVVGIITGIILLIHIKLVWN